MKAVLIEPYADVQPRAVEVPEGDAEALAFMQQSVGGYIEVVPLTYSTDAEHGSVLIVDEDGKIKADPILNVRASSLSRQPIVGTVLVLGRDGTEFADVPSSLEERLTKGTEER